MVIVDEKNKRKEYFIEAPEILEPVFEDYPKKKINLGVIQDDEGKEHLIEIIHTNADKKNERMVFYACNHRIVKGFPTEYNAVAVVNCNALPITKDRSGFEQNHRISQEIVTRVEAFLAKNYEKASVFSNLTQKEREQHHIVLEELNKLAEQEGLIGPKDIKDTKSKGEAEVKREMESEQWLKTSRDTPPAELKDADILWQKQPGKIVPPEEENAVTGGNPPGDEGQAGGENTVVVDPLQERKVLVQEMIEDKRRNTKQWAVRAKVIEAGHKRTIKNGFFAIAVYEDPDQNISVMIGRKDQHGTIWLNTNGNFFRLHKPSTFPRPQFRMEDVLPLIAEGATEILYGTDMAVAEYKQRYSILLHKLCALFLRPEAEENTEQNGGEKPVDNDGDGPVNNDNNE